MSSEEYLENLIGRVNSQPDDYLRTLNSEIIGLVLHAGRIGDLHDVEQLMSRIEITKANLLGVATLLRCSLRFTSFLMNWFSLRDRLVLELPKHPTIDGKSLMIGLIDIDRTYQPPTELDGIMRIHPNFRK